MRRISAFAAALLVVCSVGARAGDGTGTIKIFVLDQDGLEIPDARVTLSCPSLIGGRQERTTDVEGRAAFVGIPPGTCSVDASHAGFAAMSKRDITVSPDRTTVVTFELRVGSEEVLIEGRSFLSRIPSGRSYPDVMSATAGVIGGGANSNSGSMNENTYGFPPPAPTGGDRYAPVDEAGFHVVADSPLSTFSIDVDTASFSNVRRFLADGQRPPVDAVRIEELLNYFPYAYPPPTEAVGANVEVTATPWAPGHRLVRIGLRAADLPEGETPPRNLVFLVDVSGSMASPDRLPLVIDGLQMLSGQLERRDHVAIVVYAGAAGVVLPPTPGDAHGVIRSALSRLHAGGSTAGGAGLKAAYALAREHFQAGAINRVILATDGDFNVGVSSDAELVRMVESERESGVYLTVLGVGRGNLQDAKMELLADRGNGNYAYIDTFAEMRKVLVEQAGQTLVTVAKDVKLQLEFNPAQVSAWRLVGYENRTLADRDFRDDAKDAGEMGAGHTVTALYEVVPASEAVPSEVPRLRYQAPRRPAPAADSGELLTVRLRWKPAEGGRVIERELAVRDPGLPFTTASDDTRWAASVAGFGMLLRDSAHRGSMDWEWVRTTARDALGPDTEGYRAEFLGMIERARKLPSELAAAE